MRQYAGKKWLPSLYNFEAELSLSFFKAFRIRNLLITGKNWAIDSHMYVITVINDAVEYHEIVKPLVY